MITTLRPKVLDPAGGLRLQSSPGRDLVFKVTGEDTDGAVDYAIVDVEARNGPPLHVHHRHHEAIHVVEGRFKVRIGEDEAILERDGFALMPAGVAHAFLNLTDEPALIILVYSPGGMHGFFAELGPLTRDGTADKAEVAACFERHGMTLLGPPLSPE